MPIIPRVRGCAQLVDHTTTIAPPAATMAVGDAVHTGTGTKEREGEGALPLQPVPPHPWVWTGAEVLAKEREWKYALTAQEQEELIAAAKSAVATGKEIVVGAAKKAARPLPTP